MKDGFAHLHTHTHSSGFDGFGKEDKFAKRVKELGQKHLAITEHGTLRGLLSAQKACDEEGVHFVPGIEAYLCDDMDQRGLTPEDRKAIVNSFSERADDYEFDAAAFAREDYATDAAFDAALADARRHAESRWSRSLTEQAKAAVKKAEADRRDRDHITIWAMNDEGRRNLFKLTSEAWNRGFYYKPRLDLDLISEYAEGLLVSTGCPGGVVTAPIRRGDFDAAITRFERLHAAFGDRLYVEVMPHVMDDCPDLQSHLVSLARSYGSTVIATQDAHYPTPDDAFSQEVLLSIHTGECVDDPDRFAAKAFGKHEFYLRTRQEMIDSIAANTRLSRADIVRACDATVDMANRCTARIDGARPGEHLVAPGIPAAYDSYDDWILDVCIQGWESRFGAPITTAPRVYVARLKKELDVLKDKGFSAYILTVWDVIDHCRSVGIRVGPGRGSAAGSLVAYLMGITQLDPLAHRLSFSRFISPGRKGLPDIDVDIQHDRRDEVIAYLERKYGDDRVAHISTSITMRGKGVLRDVARAYAIPVGDVERVTAVIAEGLSEEDRGGNTVELAVRDTEAGKTFASTYPDAADAAVALEGQLRATGIHPAGIVISPVPMTEIVPLESRKRSGDDKRTPVIAFNMSEVEEMGLVKIDFLGLKAMTIQALAAERAGVTFEELDAIDLEDPLTLEGFTDNRFGGIFQFDSSSSRRLCKTFEFVRFADEAIITSVNRPGPMKTGLAKSFLDRAKSPSLTPRVHPVYDKITEETYGVLVFQEQLVSLAEKLAGYTPDEADKFRKKVAKKIGIGDEELKFVSGCVARGMDEEDALHLFKSIVGFGSYAFGRGHAFSYAMIAHQLMWLKLNHPGAFFAATLSVRDKAEELARLSAEARRNGIPVLAPDVNVSTGRFTFAEVGGKPAIVGATADIKGIGTRTARGIASVLPFTSLKDFYEKTRDAEGRVTAATFKALAETSALRSIVPNTKLLAANAVAIWKLLQNGYDVQLDPAAVKDYEEDELIRLASKRYKMFVNESGRGDLAAAYDEVLESATRPLLRIEEVPDEGPDYAFAIARLNNARIYAEADGGRSGRVSLLSEAGEELVARVGSDVLSAYGTTLSQKGEVIVVLLAVRSHAHGVSYDVEAAWLASEAARPVPGTLLAEVANAPRTKPRDPMAIFHRAKLDGAIKIEGTVVRVRRHKDKNQQNMLTVGLLAERSYIRFFVFASRFRESDAKQIEVGARIRATVKKLSMDAVCLGRTKVELA